MTVLKPAKDITHSPLEVRIESLEFSRKSERQYSMLLFGLVGGTTFYIKKIKNQSNRSRKNQKSTQQSTYTILTGI